VRAGVPGLAFGFNSNWFDYSRDATNATQEKNDVSIPTGSITVGRRALFFQPAPGFNSNWFDYSTTPIPADVADYQEFQFQLVRLQSARAPGDKDHVSVSIPTGSITVSDNYRRYCTRL